MSQYKPIPMHENKMFVINTFLKKNSIQSVENLFMGSDLF